MAPRRGPMFIVLIVLIREAPLGAECRNQISLLKELRLINEKRAINISLLKERKRGILKLREAPLEIA